MRRRSRKPVEHVEQPTDRRKFLGTLAAGAGAATLLAAAARMASAQRSAGGPPPAGYWENLLYDLSKTKTDMKDPQQLQLYRLMLEVNVLKMPEDYTEMAVLADEAGAPGEAVEVLAKGIGANVFPDQRSQEKNKRLLEIMKQHNADMQAQLPAKTRAAEAAPTGAQLVKIGCAYMGLKQYPQAIDALNKALAKGGLYNGDADARLTLGVVQFRAGNRDEAVKDFHHVKGDPTLERIASLWALRAQ